MPAQALYRKWRPQLWDEVVGQEHVIQTLRNALRTDHIAHAYLFSGPRGCGKTTTARLVAKALNCTHPDPAQRPDNTCPHCVAVTEGRFLDLIEIDGASNNGVENIRELRDKINFSPGEGRYKIYIIDEVHMLSTGAFNALLKTLEEPPPHAIFILATTESHKIPATVSSRCQRFEFRRIPLAETIARLNKLCEQEHLTVEPAALEMVARQATGSLRDAISLLDQLVGASEQVTLAQAQELLGTSSGPAVGELVDALAANELAAGLQVVNRAIDAGVDPRQMARQVVDHLRNLMLVRLGNAALVEATADTRALLARQAEQLDVPALLRAIRVFNAAANDARSGWQPQLPLELAMVECTSPMPAASPIPAPAAAPAAPSRPAAQPARQAPPAAVPKAQRSEAAGERAGSREPGDADASERTARPRATQARPAAGGEEAQGIGQAADTAAAPVGDIHSTGELTASWNRLMGRIREHDKATAALLHSCGVLGMEGHTLRLSANDFVYKKIMANPETSQKIETLLGEVLGFECAVKLEVEGERRRSARSRTTAA